MTKPMPGPEPLDLEPHGDVLRVPEDKQPEGGKPPPDPGVDVPAKPGAPAPYPENPDLPGEPPEPADPGQGQPIPPELDTTKPRL